VNGEWPDLLPEFIEARGDQAYPVLRLALLTVVVQTPAPHLAAPLRKLGRRVLFCTALAGVILDVASVTGLIGALAVGYGVAAIIHFVFGSPEGLLTGGRLRGALAELGLDVAEAELAPVQPVGVGLAHAVDGDGRQLLVKVYGRDAADAQLAAKAWRSIWYRDTGPAASLTGLQQVEHEAVALLLAAQRGVRVPVVVAAGETTRGDALLVTEWPAGRSAVELGRSDVDGDLLDAAWKTLADLHAAGIAHGGIDARSTYFDEAGVLLTDLAGASLSASARWRQGDRVAMLAALACVAGPERAVDSAVRSLTVEQLTAMLPYLQEVVLSPELRRQLDDADLRFDRIADELVERIDVERPPLAGIRRVGLKDVILVAFAIFAVNAIVSQIAEIGFDVFVEELRSASIAWLALAFVVNLFGYVGELVSLRGAVTQPVPFGPTVLVESAKRFVGLAVPTVAGRVAVNIRYLQKLGVPVTVAVTQSPLISLAGFIDEVALLLLSSWAIGQSIDTEDLDTGNAVTLIVIGAAVVVIGVIVVLAVPRWRNAVVPRIREGYESVADVTTSPRRLVRVFGGQLIERLTGALALSATLAAFGLSASFAAVIFVSVGVGLLAGLAPVPGGIGVAEALLTALLTAIGIPAESAFSVAITYRLVTSYLPPILGWFSLRWLTDHGYL